MKEGRIQKISINDIIRLQKIAKQTFAETFAENNTEENLQIYLEEGFSVEKLTSELNNPNAEFYFAIKENNPIGYLKINFGPAQTELQDDSSLEIERIYVLKEYHGQNIGQLLFEKAHEIAKSKKVAYIWLGVWEENHRALSFYKKNGFEVFNKHLFKLGSEEQTDLMMKLTLK
ncbi:GNAT family N-acetyltransferase [Flavobacterium sp.]|uniref:GNAT family N-acetyltransferase n=1 Tax=Flavobacterium sp. TaxID=239 RepID=UPI00260A4C7C|nr:GNAT family N-acetyltransferase [Flavobacterium sp.]